eukprot:TRINITY_DN26786_c0_g1_i1.p1 TRINITY_DN26786_c0_g1~~TRINITY_DN26786_c0_g1_i1.p1  ORF type:complete len:132 (-),score=34.63 TRINITY_DN26786_c0_g1_i1:31-426(-)
MRADLKVKDVELYTQNGILNMLERNRKIKRAPERWQEQREHFDVVITFEERVFDLVIKDIQSRHRDSLQPVHIINIETKDNPADAIVGAQVAGQLAQALVNTEDIEEEVEAVIEGLERKNDVPFLHTILFF